MNVHKNAKLTPRGRGEMVRRVEEEGQSVPEVALAYGVSERTVWKWVLRHRRHGERGLEDRSSRPRRSPTRLTEYSVRRIVELRHRRWTGRRIARDLKLAVSTVGRWLRRLGLGRLKYLDPPEPVVRYERDVPGELLHVDIKPLGRIDGIGHRIHGDRRGRKRGSGWEYLHVCIDDATRAAYTEVLEDQRADTACGFMERSVAWFARHRVQVQSVMTACYTDVVNRECSRSVGSSNRVPVTG